MKHNWISNSFLCHPLHPCTPSNSGRSMPAGGAFVAGCGRSMRGRYFFSSAQSAQQTPPSRAADRVPQFDPSTGMHTYETGRIRQLYVVRSLHIQRTRRVVIILSARTSSQITKKNSYLTQCYFLALTEAPRLPLLTPSLSVDTHRASPYHSSCTPELLNMHAQRVDGVTSPRSFIKWSRICATTQGGGRALWLSRTLPTTRRRLLKARVIRRAGSPAPNPKLLEAQLQQ